MKPVLWSAAALVILSCAIVDSWAQRKPVKKPARPAATRPAMPKQENQFVTVDEYIRARKPAGTAVSIEGYAALGYRAADGSVRLYVVDSVDHILSARDADGAAASGAAAVIPAGAIRVHPAWGWSPKGSMRIPMFTGNGAAQRQLRDVAPKIRLTGWTASGRATISPVTKVEITNENGEYVAVR